MAERKVVVVANVIKFGIPFGIASGSSILLFAALFREGGITFEDVGRGLTMLVLSMFGGVVLGLMRSRSS